MSDLLGKFSARVKAAAFGIGVICVGHFLQSCSEEVMEPIPELEEVSFERVMNFSWEGRM